MEARALLEEAMNLSLANHDTRNVSLCLAAFAQLALLEGDPPERAARLLGAAEGVRQRAGLRPWPTGRRDGADPAAQARQALGVDRFDQEFAAGARLSQRQAVAAVHEVGRGNRPIAAG